MTLISVPVIRDSKRIARNAAPSNLRTAKRTVIVKRDAAKLSDSGASDSVLHESGNDIPSAPTQTEQAGDLNWFEISAGTCPEVTRQAARDAFANLFDNGGTD